MGWRFHGNWGGPSWSDGHLVTPGEIINFDGPYTDIVDKQFRTHDQGYDNAIRAYEASDRTNADCARYWTSIIIADVVLKRSLRSLVIPQTLSDQLDGVATAALDAFELKTLYNLSGLATCRIPRQAEEVGGDPFTGMPWPGIDSSTSDFYTHARNWVEPGRDPLVLDLNGGGISTSGINPAAPLYFDHAGDGLPNATGWVGAGEGLVVRDLNGNGLIDSGRELFGDNTVLTSGPNAGKNATDGFAALRDLDSNADGKFDASDAAFSSVKIWKDQNQDGISQSTELFSFAEQGVQAINLSATASNINLGGGNTQTFAGSFTRVGGGTGAAGTADLVGNLLLSSNNFYHQFNDDPVLTPTCGRARRASVPTGLRARGLGACGTRPSSRQHHGLHANSAATANWLRPTGTATRHACGGGWRASGGSQVRKVQLVRNAVVPITAALQTRNHHWLGSHAVTCGVGRI